MDLNKLLSYSVDSGASDLHLSVGSIPMVRINGTMQPLNMDPLKNSDMESILPQVLDEDQMKKSFVFLFLTLYHLYLKFDLCLIKNFPNLFYLYLKFYYSINLKFLLIASLDYLILYLLKISKYHRFF